MRHHIYKENNDGVYSNVILVRETSMQVDEIKKHYIDPLLALGHSLEDFIVFNLRYKEDGKVNKTMIKEYLEELLPVLNDLQVENLLVTDTNYYKEIVSVKRVSGLLGSPVPCAIKDYEHLTAFLTINFKTIIYSPVNQEKLDLTIEQLDLFIKGKHKAIGSDIIHTEYYPETLEDIKSALDSLHEFDELTSDIETFSLSMFDAGIGSIGFAIDQNNGFSFLCDYSPLDEPFRVPAVRGSNGVKGKQAWIKHGDFKPNPEVRKLIRQFFEEYKGKIIWHNANFDLKILIYVLWMEHDLDHENMLKGIDVMTKHIDDTRLIAYLSLNSAQGNILNLKELSYEYTGDYSQDPEDIKDIRRIPKEELLKYNLIDCLGTRYVYDKHLPIMIKDQQEEVYYTILKPSIKLHLRAELHGVPINEDKLNLLNTKMLERQKGFYDAFHQSPKVKEFSEILKKRHVDKRNSELVSKVITMDCDETKAVKLNPASDPQLSEFLYDFLKLPIIDLTDTGNPSVSGKTLKRVMNHVTDESIKTILNQIDDIVSINIIISTFIKAFLEGRLKADGRRYLHGNFNIGGAVSGRLSSSDPNLQNLPNGGLYGGWIKELVEALSGWVMLGADFASLEDRIYALLTKDENRLKVYTDGYDGHCLRAFAYFGNLMPDIEDSLESINSIKYKYPELREASKNPTFLLTYLGTKWGLMRNYGFTEEQAESFVNNYQLLYKDGIAFIDSLLDQAEIDGFVTCAFGLRLRTPLMKRKGKGEYVNASSERRTAGNALGQSFCMLNSRAAIEFLSRLEASEYNHRVHIIMLIHDAIYVVAEEDPEVVLWVNKNLIECMKWNEIETIQHDSVKIEAELDIFFPSWNNPFTIPNDCNKESLFKLTDEHLEKLNAA